MHANFLSIPRAFESALGFRISPSTAFRYWKYGVDGIKLKSYRIGGRRFTTIEDVLSFKESCSTQRATVADTPPKKQCIEETKVQLDFELNCGKLPTNKTIGVSDE